jgi:hypothetical protein
VLCSIFHINLGLCKVGDRQLEAVFTDTEGLFAALLDCITAYEKAPDPSVASGLLLTHAAWTLHCGGFYQG